MPEESDDDDEEAKKAKKKKNFEGIECEDSLFLFNKNNIIRRFCYGVVHHP